MFNFFIEKELVVSNQSDFKLDNSYINQLFFISHQIYELFDVELEFTSISLDISSTFHKI